MSLARLLVLLFALLATPAPLRSTLAADAFVPGINDLPLMPGLKALPGEGTVFDAPAGRVIEAWAEGAVARDAVLSFYGNTLPQLGWRSAGPGLFRREGEALRLEFPASGIRSDRASGTLLIRFYLSPG